MREPYGLTLLTAKYSEMAGQLEALDKEAKAIKAAMTHLMASIRLVQHGHNEAYIPRKNPYQINPYVKRGAYARVAMDVLRDAPEAISAREICLTVLRRHGAVDPDEKLVQRMTRAMETCLMKKVKDGKLQVDRNYHPKRFSLIKGV